MGCIQSTRGNEAQKIAALKIYFHPSAMGGPAKTPVAEKTEATVKAFCDAMAKHHKDEAASFIDLFANDFRVEDPAGAPPTTEKAKFKEFIAGLPEIEYTLINVNVAADDLQCAAMIEWDIKGVGKVVVFDCFKFNADHKIVDLKVYFHPSAMGGAAKTPVAEKTQTTVKAFCDAMAKHHQDGAASFVDLFANGFSVEDPVGSPLTTDRAKFKEFIAGLPEIGYTLKQLNVGADESQCAAAIEWDIKGVGKVTVIDCFTMS